MSKEKLYIKGIEISKAEDLQGFQNQVDTLDQEFADYQTEINASLEDIKDEVKQIVLEGGAADPIFISSTGINISIIQNKDALLNALNSLLKRDKYPTDWLAVDTAKTTYDIYPGNVPVIFLLENKSYAVNHIIIRDNNVDSTYLGVSFFLDGSWAKDGQTSREPYMESYYEHIEDISYTEFYISKEEYRNQELLNIYSDNALTLQDYVPMNGQRYYNPVDYYQTLTTNNEIAYEPKSPYHPATKKYVDDKALISAFTYFMESDTEFGNVDVVNNESQTIIFGDNEKAQLTEFINRYRQQKSFLHVTLADSTEFLCDSLDTIDLNPTTNVFALTLQSKDEEMIGTVYMEGTRNADTWEYTVNIARITIVRNPKAEQYADLQTYVDTTIGNLEDLETTDKTSVVAAVNETLGTFTADYYTKEEVKLAPYTIKVNKSANVTDENISIADLNTISNAITDAYKKGQTSIDFLIQYNKTNNIQSIFLCSMVGNLQIQQTYYEGYYYHNNLHSLRRVYVSGTWSDNVYTASTASISLAFDMWSFVSTRNPGVTSYTIPTQTDFTKAPKLNDHSTITEDSHLVDKQYVTEAINAIPGVDLSGYYTKDEVDTQFTTVNKTKQDKLTAGDNITISNNIISATGSSDAATLDATIPSLDFSDGFASVNNNGVNTISTAGMVKLSELFTKHYQKNGNFKNLVFLIKGNGVCELFYPSSTTNTSTQIYFSRRGFKITGSNGNNGSSLFSEYLNQDYFNITINGATVTCTGVNGGTSFTSFASSTLSNALSNQVLTKNNTTSYTPSNTYHPATKGYVDDSVNNVKNTLTTSIDTKQDKLIAGTNITIENNIISATNVGGSGGIGDSNLQVSEIPEASEENEGAIVQYTGTDTDEFKKGYFYRSVVDHVYAMDSLTTTGGYATTSLPLKANYKIEMKVKLNTYTSGAHFFNSSGNSNYYCLRVYNGYYSYGNNNSVTTSSIAYSTGTELVLTYNDDEGNITVNDSIIATGIATPSAYGNLQLFNNSSKMTFYYCKVWDKTTGELVAHYLPVSFDGIITIYDIINNIAARWTTYSSITAGTIETNLTSYRYWIPQAVQELKPSYTWVTALQEPEFYEDLQTIMSLYKSGIYANYSLAGYRLGHIVAGNTSSATSSNYRIFTLYLTRLYNTTSYTRTITLRTTYSDYILYGPQSLYPVTINTTDTTNTYLTSHQSLANYLGKDNTTAFTPTGNYNPATKKYVDDTIAGADFTGQFLAKDNREEYIPGNPYNPATKLYVENYTNQLINTVSGMKFKPVQELPTTDMQTNVIYLVGTTQPYSMYAYVENEWVYLGNSEFDIEPIVEEFSGQSTGPEIIVSVKAVDGASYGFAKNGNGFYESQNKGQHNTAALCKIVIDAAEPIQFPITYIQTSEANYDYALFSQLNRTLTTNMNDDGATGSTNVFKNCRGESSTNPVTIIYEIPVGHSEIYVKYRKDGSANSGNDSIQFQMQEQFITGAEYTIDVLKGNYIYKLNKLGYLNITSAPFFNKETTIFMNSEVNGLYVTMPSTWTHLGDKPRFTVDGNGNCTGFLAGNYEYIASFLAGTVIWKKYKKELEAEVENKEE